MSTQFIKNFNFFWTAFHFPVRPRQKRAKISSQRKKDEILHFSSHWKFAENAQNCGQIQFSARVSCDMT